MCPLGAISHRNATGPMPVAEALYERERLNAWTDPPFVLNRVNFVIGLTDSRGKLNHSRALRRAAHGRLPPTREVQAATWIPTWLHSQWIWDPLGRDE